MDMKHKILNRTLETVHRNAAACLQQLSTYSLRFHDQTAAFLSPSQEKVVHILPSFSFEFQGHAFLKLTHSLTAGKARDQKLEAGTAWENEAERKPKNKNGVGLGTRLKGLQV